MPEVEVQDRTWDRCIDRLFHAVGHELQLADALGEFRPFFDAQGVQFVTLPDEHSPHGSHTASASVPDRMMIEYHAHFHVHDEWVLAAQRRSDFQLGAIYRGS